MFVVVVLAGRYAIRPIMKRVAAADTPELFTAAGLLIVIGTSLAMSAVGLSMSLGAFLAGVLLSESEFRHELHADIRSEEHTSELQSIMRNSYAVFCLKK